MDPGICSGRDPVGGSDAHLRWEHLGSSRDHHTLRPPLTSRSTYFGNSLGHQPDSPACPVSSPASYTSCHCLLNSKVCSQLLLILEFHRRKDQRSYGKSGHRPKPQVVYSQGECHVLLIPDELAFLHRLPNNQRRNGHSHIFHVHSHMKTKCFAPGHTVDENVFRNVSYHQSANLT